MLSSSPAIPIHKFDFHDRDRRRLSLHTAHGQFTTSQDGLPSPEGLTPVTGMTPGHGMTPIDGSPDVSPAPSAPMSRRGSSHPGAGGGVGGHGDQSETATPLRSPTWDGPDGGDLAKVPSRGGLWHDEVSIYKQLSIGVCFPSG